MNHLFPYKWNLADGYPAKGIAFHGHQVFGTFICGGGSTMGYKLAGYKHLGGVEIDPKVAIAYKANHKPEHLYVEDIRAFNERTDLPEVLFNLDLLDGSPPCSSFSMAGSREKGWGKQKVFREGQAHQRLDDLVFAYVDTIVKLRPKIAILENVKGILAGNAKAYTKEIVKRLRTHGYIVQVFVLNAATMGVPQMRERAFFIARRNANWPNLILDFTEPAITFGKVRLGVGKANNEHDMRYWEKRIKSDRAFDDISLRLEGKATNWNSKIIHDDMVCNTVTSTAGSKLLHYDIPYHLSNASLSNVQTFPQDYNFGDLDARYVIGMSVPPIMTAQIAHQIHLQWLQNSGGTED